MHLQEIHDEHVYVQDARRVTAMSEKMDGPIKGIRWFTGVNAGNSGMKRAAWKWSE